MATPPRPLLPCTIKPETNIRALELSFPNVLYAEMLLPSARPYGRLAILDGDVSSRLEPITYKLYVSPTYSFTDVHSFLAEKVSDIANTAEWASSNMPPTTHPIVIERPMNTSVYNFEKSIIDIHCINQEEWEKAKMQFTRWGQVYMNYGRLGETRSYRLTIAKNFNYDYVWGFLTSIFPTTSK